MIAKMNFLNNFLSENVYFYIISENDKKVTGFDKFQNCCFGYC